MIENLLEKFFTPRQIAEFSISDETATLRDTTFKVGSTGKLEAVCYPDDDWLRETLDQQSGDRKLWTLAAYLKVRRLSQPSDVSERARSGSLYDEDYYTRRGGGSPYVGYPFEENGFDGAVSFSALAAEIVATFHPRQVLDVGCATGVLVKALQERGVAAKGVDISDWAISNGVTFGLLQASALDLPFADNSFDLVISQDFMEHIHPEDLPKVLAEQIRVSRSGATLCHFIPFYETERPLQIDAHLCNASFEWWQNLLEQTPNLKISKVAPKTDQWSNVGGRLSRYFWLAVHK